MKKPSLEQQAQFFDTLKKFIDAYQKFADEDFVKGFVVVDCPKCDGKMVPLSGYHSPMTGVAVSLPFAKWRCVKCGYTVP